MRKFRHQCAIFYTFCLFLLILIPIFHYFYSPIIPPHYEVYVNEKMHKIFNGQRKNGGNRDKNIGIFVMVENAADLEREYGIAHRTLQCYCLQKNYPLFVVDISKNATLQGICPQKDFMFRRHCAFAHFLLDHPQIEWALFLDADMAVVNPNNFLEKYLPAKTNFDLIFPERIFNGEIVAGSYFARNTNSSVDFLHFWANYFYKLPWSWHGTDNGAIHAVFMDYFCPEGNSKLGEICWKLWRKSKDDDGLRMFTDCTKWVLGKRNEFESKNANLTVQFLTDFRQFWARDIWLTESKWAARDFLLHGLKRSWQNKSKWGSWESPFLNEEFERKMDLEKCALGEAEWPYDPKMMEGNAEVEQKIARKVEETRMEHFDYLRRIEEFAEQNGIF